MVKLDGKDASVVFEVGISREDCPISSQGDRTNQSVDNRDGDSFACTLIARPSGSFVVCGFNSNVSKRAKEHAKPFELGWSSNARQNFLTD